MPVIDASVYVAIVNTDDVHHHASRQWIEATLRAGETIQAPVIILGEVAAAISRGVKDQRLAIKTVERLERSSIIQLAPISLSLAKSAARIAAEQRIRDVMPFTLRWQPRLANPSSPGIVSKKNVGPH